MGRCHYLLDFLVLASLVAIWPTAVRKIGSVRHSPGFGMASQSLTETSASQSLTASGDEIQAEIRELKQRVIFLDWQLRERQHQYRE